MQVAEVVRLRLPLTAHFSAINSFTHVRTSPGRSVRAERIRKVTTQAFGAMQGDEIGEGQVDRTDSTAVPDESEFFATLPCHAKFE